MLKIKLKQFYTATLATLVAAELNADFIFLSAGGGEGGEVAALLHQGVGLTTLTWLQLTAARSY